MNKVEEIIETQLAGYRQKFKPVFGSQASIDIAKLSAKLDGLEKELAKKEAAKQGAITLKNEIKQLKRNLLFTFKNL